MNTPANPSVPTWSQVTPAQPGHYWFWDGTEDMSPRPFALTDILQAPAGWWLEMIKPPAPLSALKHVQGSLSPQLLSKALASAVRHTIENDTPEARKAWLTHYGVYAIYPAIYEDIARVINEELGANSAPRPEPLLDSLIENKLIPVPRGYAVRETVSIRQSLLNAVIEIKADDVWGPNMHRPEHWFITSALGLWYQKVATLMGLPPTIGDSLHLYLHTLRAKPAQRPLEAQESKNAGVVLAIYWRVREFEGDPDPRSTGS